MKESDVREMDLIWERNQLSKRLNSDQPDADEHPTDEVPEPLSKDQLRRLLSKKLHQKETKSHGFDSQQ